VYFYAFYAVMLNFFSEAQIKNLHIRIRFAPFRADFTKTRSCSVLLSEAVGVLPLFVVKLALLDSYRYRHHKLNGTCVKTLSAHCVFFVTIPHLSDKI